jgi:hypothetical protein
MQREPKSAKPRQKRKKISLARKIDHSHPGSVESITRRTNNSDTRTSMQSHPLSGGRVIPKIKRFSR